VARGRKGPDQHACADGPMAKEPPTKAGDIKLILSGKFLDSTKALSGASPCLTEGGLAWQLHSTPHASHDTRELHVTPVVAVAAQSTGETWAMWGRRT
jgi:hypothetical protein